MPGFDPLGNRNHLTDNQRACADALREALVMAEEGKVEGLGVALCMDGGWASLVAGGRPGDLHIACHDLQNKILDAVLNAPKNKASRLLKIQR